jgi:hypothetical protein
VQIPAALPAAAVNMHIEKETAFADLKAEVTRLSSLVQSVKDTDLSGISKTDIDALVTECRAHKRH